MRTWSSTPAPSSKATASTWSQRKKEQPDAKINVVGKDDPAPHPDKAREKGTMESKGNASGEAKDNGPNGGRRL
jgi:hypothetical protein